jgi:hypothetical protein
MSVLSTLPSLCICQKLGGYCGWIPERLVDSNGAPYGWAGAMSLPRLIVPYQDTEGSWFVRTPPLQAALDELYLPTSGSSFTKDNLIVSTAPSSPAAGETALAYLDEMTGDQLEIVVSLDVGAMSQGDLCGVRLLSSLSGSSPALTQDTEYTDVGLHFLKTISNSSTSVSDVQSIELYVDTHHSTANLSSPVNRTTCSAYPFDVTLLIDSNSSSRMVQLQILLDHSVIESFLAEGTRVITRRSYPSYPDTSTHLQLFASSSQSTNTTVTPTVCSFAFVSIKKLRNANLTEYSEEPPSPSNRSEDDDAVLSSAMIAVVVIVVVAVVGLGLGGYYLLRRRQTERSEAKKILLN